MCSDTLRNSKRNGFARVQAGLFVKVLSKQLATALLRAIYTRLPNGRLAFLDEIDLVAEARRLCIDGCSLLESHLLSVAGRISWRPGRFQKSLPFQWPALVLRIIPVG